MILSKAKLLIGILPGLFFLMSCGSKISSKQEQKLSELRSELDSTYEAISSLDSATIRKISNYYHEKRNYITKEMDDTLEPETLFYIDTFLVIKKVIRFFDNQYFPILEEARTMKKQLRDLEHDVENGLVNEEQFEDYFQAEQDNFLKLKNVSSDIDRLYKTMTGKYNRMSPKIDSIVNATKTKSND